MGKTGEHNAVLIQYHPFNSTFSYYAEKNVGFPVTEAKNLGSVGRDFFFKYCTVALKGHLRKEIQLLVFQKKNI